MTANKNIKPYSYTTSSGPQFNTVQTPTRANGLNTLGTSNIIDQPREGELVREMLTWKTPHLGYVQMYVNPQNLMISETKDISSIRTKAGFIVQYAGERLTQIQLSGTTGSSGMEGINILEQIYRSEQYAFENIAETLDRSVTSAQMLALFKGAFNVGPTGIDIVDNFVSSPIVDNFVSSTTAEAVLDIYNQPFPTLASLAASVEMFFQGVNYRGYFKGFKVTEQAASPGLFDYSLDFESYAKQGIRRNFMPWHRQPSSPADSNGPNHMSFYGKAEEYGFEPTESYPESGSRVEVGEVLIAPGTRASGVAVDINGQNIIGLDLRDTEV